MRKKLATLRMIHIGLVNEIALMCDRIGVNVWEVIEAAATKPFGFTPFYPLPGLGGHCIPNDPFLFDRKTKQAGIGFYRKYTAVALMQIGSVTQK